MRCDHVPAKIPKAFLADDSDLIRSRVGAMLGACAIFSNKSGPAYRTRYLGAGAASFLDKSIEFDQLPQAVTKASQAPA